MPEGQMDTETHIQKELSSDSQLVCAADVSMRGSKGMWQNPHAKYDHMQDTGDRNCEIFKTKPCESKLKQDSAA